MTQAPKELLPIIFVEVGDVEAENRAVMIIEEGRWYELDKGWRVRADQPHVKGMTSHNHLYLKGDQVAVVNRNGTPSHNSDLSLIPNHVWKSLRKNRLIETASLKLRESQDMVLSVPATVINSAYEILGIESLSQRFARLVKSIRH